MPTAPAVAAAPSAAPRLLKFEDVVALARAKRDVALTRALEHDMRIARFEPGRIEFTPTPTASPTLAPTLAKKLGEWTGERWMIAIAQGATAPTLRETASREGRREARGRRRASRGAQSARAVSRRANRCDPGAGGR